MHTFEGGSDRLHGVLALGTSTKVANSVARSPPIVVCCNFVFDGIQGTRFWLDPPILRFNGNENTFINIAHCWNCSSLASVII